MAVPGRRNGMEEDEDEGVLFEEEGIALEIDSDIPPHLRPLSDASEIGDVNLLRQALDNFTGSIDEPVDDGDTALHLTCLYGHLSCVELLLLRGASLEVKDEDGGIPLHDACAGGFTEIVRLLIEYANNSEPSSVKRMLDTVDVEGDTPLHHAARGGHADIVRLLLDTGASPTAVNIYGKISAELADEGTEARTVLEALSNGVGNSS